MNGRPRSEALLFSLSEFAFVLLFLSIGVAALLGGEAQRARAEASRLQRKAQSLEASLVTMKQEVAFLEEMLEEVRHGVVPCWRRPEQKMPILVGTVTIHDRDRYSLERHGDTEETAELTTFPTSFHDDLDEAVRALFQEDLAYAAQNQCYLRISVRNTTNSHRFYQEAVEVIRRSSMVVVHE